ncbi:MAG: hypothetical protein A3K19_25910 [Lentisphaerae bacterium RIFOXYB12_FULL_65_16]|nr:MAG: hypothetical protein A3K18_31910 [Lentisphaerae bacterium RIFOXYA12_64_32]OGV91407.1 MAG: hypothetical protein A3K19_25910 [Lentisphaerae bacterium RIFOXYB12_FULL_65_16]
MRRHDTSGCMRLAGLLLAVVLVAAGLARVGLDGDWRGRGSVRGSTLALAPASAAKAPCAVVW